MPHERIKNWWGWKKVTSLFTASLLWIWSVRAAERLTISDLIIFLHNALVLWCMIQDLLPISFFEFFFLLSLYYIDLKFDCPFNTIVIQTLNDEFKSQKTLQQRKFTCERNCLRVLFSSNHFNICTANSVWFFWCQAWKCRK